MAISIPLARYDGEKRTPRDVPNGEDAECLECGGRLRVWDPTGYIRHFKHVGNFGGGDGVGGAACATVAESYRHIVWKYTAVERLEQIFDGNIRKAGTELKLPAPKTDKDHRKADAAVIFEDADDQLVQGVVVEVQHKNESKDKDGTVKDYNAVGLATVWVFGGDFSDNDYTLNLNEIDIRQRAKDAVWPKHVPDSGIKPEVYLQQIHLWPESVNPEKERSVEVPAKLPKPWFDEKTRGLWENQPWRSLFDPPVDHLPNTEGKPRGTFHLKKWLAESGQILKIQPLAQMQLMDPRSLSPPAKDYLIPENVLDACLPEKRQIVKKDITELSKPANPFDDVQCRVCGTYWHYTNGYTNCPGCDEPVDWEWNVSTGRISTDAIPE